MTTSFYKYHGTGNDFILIDNRQHSFPKNDTKLVAAMCDRHFGIGADGLILLEEDGSADFNMVYFNADGNEGSLCGNGARCTVAFAKTLGIIGSQASFKASDGQHSADIKEGVVRLKMNEVGEVVERDGSYFLDTGSPHHVQLAKDLSNFDVIKEGARIRYGVYGPSGANINFVEQIGPDRFAVRTYERGVEDETYSCGTGVTAVALAMYHAKKTARKTVYIDTRGGKLQVDFEPHGKNFKDIYLEGPAVQVFKGSYSWTS